MKRDFEADAVAAIAALSRSVESIEHRLDLLTDAIAERTKARRNYILSTAACFFGKRSLNVAVLGQLRSYFPGFVTADVQKAFELNRKVLGLFKPSGHDRALEQIQTKLASFLDHSKYGNLPAMDAELAQMLGEQSELRDRSRNVTELIKMLGEAKRYSTPLPEEVQAQVGRIAASARERSSQRNTPARTTSATTDCSSPQHTDDFDLWFYLATDIPVSTRTLLADALYSSRRDETPAKVDLPDDRAVQYESSPGTTESSTAPATTVDAQVFNSNAGLLNVEMAAAVVAGGAAAVFAMDDLPVTTGTISTDDQLGYFS